MLRVHSATTGRETYLFCGRSEWRETEVAAPQITETEAGRQALCRGPQRDSADRRGRRWCISCRKRRCRRKYGGVTENSDGQGMEWLVAVPDTGGSAGRESFITIRNECYRDASYTPTLKLGILCMLTIPTVIHIPPPVSEGGHTKDDDNTYHVIRAGWSRPHWAADGWNTSGYQGIDTRGNTKLNVSVYADSWGNGCRFSLNRSEYLYFESGGKNHSIREASGCSVCFG